MSTDVSQCLKSKREDQNPKKCKVKKGTIKNSEHILFKVKGILTRSYVSIIRKKIL